MLKPFNCCAWSACICAWCMFALTDKQLLCRSDSAHALGESIDPEMLPDIETLTDPFELPSQLRTETYQQSPAQKAQHSHSSYPVNQLPQQPHASRNSHASYGGPSSQAGSGLLKTGATASSGAASTASDESVDPNLRAKHTAQRHTAAHPFDDLHLAYEQSGSLPLLDVDVDALTDQQAAYMLDVSPQPSCMRCLATNEPVCFRQWQ